MTQIAVVTSLPVPGSGGKVGLTVSRRTACGHACDGCGRCGGRDLAIWADSGIPVELGDRVEVSCGGPVLAIAALVYLGPVVLFLLGYLLSAGLPEGWRYLWGCAGFVLGLTGAVVCGRLVRRGQALRYQITRKL